MTPQEAQIIIGNIPIKPEVLDDCYDITEYQIAKAMAIEALEQESILDKIRAEINALPKTYPFINHFDTYVKEDDVLRIIDEYGKKVE